MLKVSPKRILIIKPSSLGDIIHALPTLAALRGRFPRAWIAWLVKRQWAEILDGHPALNEVIPASVSLKNFVQLGWTLRKKAFDLVVDLQGLFRSAFLARLTGAPMIVGFAQGREGSPLLYTHRVTLPMPPGESWRLWNMHAVDRNLCVATFLGAESDRPPEFWLPDFEDDRQVIDELLKEEGITEKDRLVAMAPLTRQAIKNWPVERFREVAHALVRLDHVKVLLIGTENQQVNRLFESLLGSRVVNLMGKTSVRQLGVVFDRVNLLIANDSGPLHIASVRRIPFVALYGPTNPAATGPYQMSPDSRVFTAPLPCRPCGQRTCRHDKPLECLTSIPVEDVVGHARRVLGNV